MSLAKGSKLGGYEIIAPIGAGGMGGVYCARDGKLKRDVAIKVILEDFAQDAERMKRFEREAQVLASLNHPHIASIYGLEENALILELVEGPTLAERVAKGPLSWEEALAIVLQIAEALEYAHEKGSFRSRPRAAPTRRGRPKQTSYFSTTLPGASWLRLTRARVNRFAPRSRGYGPRWPDGTTR
ncbi:MAG: serine/threonine protein kinase [Acidobacteria bacterium]|nr:MAG: serine/threonine protein kinase [Acidobacteriota bacterium]